ncbi:MAG: phosphotransferase family protein [Candidatus Rokuibacteriota bacterium]
MKSWARNDVWRCRVDAPGVALPPSVIVKRFKGDPERGLDEWATLAFLTERAFEPAVAPRFLGSDAAARVFVMEDLGPGRTLEDLLRDGDAAAAAEALVALARLTGSWHARLLDAAGDFDRRREALGPRLASPIAAAAAFLRGERGRITAWLEAAGVTASPELAATLEAVTRAVERPGPFATLTHGDMAPSNTHVTATTLRLLDFEYAGVRHALYDALFWTLVCPFPAALIDRADAAYRVELARACPAARADGAYAGARTTVAAWRMLNLLQWLPPSLLAADQPWAPGVSARQAVLWHLARFDAVASSAAGLAPLVETLAHLDRVLSARWNCRVDPAAVWPALREPQ